MVNQVSTLKNELIDYETVAAQATDYREKALAEAYAEYQRRLVAAGAMDFDDLIMVTVNLLQAFPDVAADVPGAGSGTCWWTSTRTPTTPSTCWSASWSAGSRHAGGPDGRRRQPPGRAVRGR